MRIIRKKNELRSFLKKLQDRSTGADSAVEKKVRDILEDVKKHGDKAVIKYTRKYDNPDAKKISLSSSEIRRFAKQADPDVLKALRYSARRIRRFHEKQTEHSWTMVESEAVLGQVIRPLSRIGVYVPGGKASYPSTVLMNVIPAQVAGVQEIALCVPSSEGIINPHVMAAIELLGIKEVYCIGGAQAIGAMAYGTDQIKKVDKIVGPGNIYVATAKKLVFGEVDIDMIAGPSEILIIADKWANSEFIASDLLSQAEHDELASSILVTDSEEVAENVSLRLTQQLLKLKRNNIAAKSIEDFGALIITDSIFDAIHISNRIAPEHLELSTKNPFELLPLIKNAGSVFLGPWTPEALGDYAAGPNHTLPTGGTARFFSPLGVYDFYKRFSILGFTRKGFNKIGGVVETFAQSEGLDAHANSVKIRRYFSNTTHHEKDTKCKTRKKF